MAPRVPPAGSVAAHLPKQIQVKFCLFHSPVCPGSHCRHGWIVRSPLLTVLTKAIMSLTVDLLIQARWIVPVETDGEVLADHALAIRDGKIVAIVPPEDVAAVSAKETVRLDRHVLMPGLVNLHCHAAMTLLRGYADDLALMDWLQNHIWPAEGKHVSDEFVYEGSLIGMAEMIRSGTTTVNDMYFYNSAVARAGLASGMRTFVGCSILEFPTNYGLNADDYIAKGLKERDEFVGEPLVTFTLAPHAPYTVSDATFRKVVPWPTSWTCRFTAISTKPRTKLPAA